MRALAILTVLAGAAILAGCSPQARIQSACERNGNPAAACRCFAGELHRNLSPPQLEAFARLQQQQQPNANDEAVQQAMSRTLGFDGALAVAAAAKRCEVRSGAPMRT
ncbi:MAG: hypothetical protein AB7J28_04290 [Hyphomonadaceae bacterium]